MKSSSFSLSLLELSAESLQDFYCQKVAPRPALFLCQHWKVSLHFCCFRSYPFRIKSQTKTWHRVMFIKLLLVRKQYIYVYMQTETTYIYILFLSQNNLNVFFPENVFCFNRDCRVSYHIYFDLLNVGRLPQNATSGEPANTLKGLPPHPHQRVHHKQ